MTQEQVIQKLKTDQFFAVNFAVDNNPFGFIDQLKAVGYNSSFDSENANNNILTAKKIIFTLIGRKNQSVINSVFNNVPYLNNDVTSAPYTKGFRDFFIVNTPTEDVNDSNYKQKGGFSFDGLFAGLGAGLLTYGTIASATASGGITTMTPEQQKAKEAEAKAAKNKKIWLYLGVGIVVILISLGIYLKTKSSKGSK